MGTSTVVTVIDDDEQVRESLAALVQSMQLDVDCYASGMEFLESFEHARPGCVVLDLRLPQISGQEVLKVLNARRIRVPVIMITGHGDIPAAVAAMKAGAFDFLEKPYRGAVLIESIRRAIAQDERDFQTQSDRHDLLTRYETLTADEKDVLWLTAEGKPDKAIAQRLDLSLRTIQLRRASVMRKLQAQSRARLIRLAETLESMPAAL
jgi:FixJ family two-component response regulator